MEARIDALTHNGNPPWSGNAAAVGYDPGADATEEKAMHISIEYCVP
jgi:hypothetical protein